MGERDIVLQCLGRCDVHTVEYEFSPIFLSQPDDGTPRKGPKHVVDLFNNLKIQLCYDGHLCTYFVLVLNHTTGMMPPKINIQFVPRSKYTVSIIEISKLILYGDIIAVCYGIHKR
jgi:hypothetical protein